MTHLNHRKLAGCGDSGQAGALICIWAIVDSTFFCSGCIVQSLSSTSNMRHVQIFDMTKFDRNI
jgi:hypothetical protein